MAPVSNRSPWRPHHRLTTRASDASADTPPLLVGGQDLAGVAAVDVAEERRVDVVAEELLEPRRQRPDDAARHGEAVVLLRAQPGGHVLQDHAEPRPAGVVGPAAVHEAAEVEH